VPVLAAGGVLLVEVAKQVKQPTRGSLAEAVRRPIRVLDGMPAPAGRLPAP
jgi:hypothetical protein